MRSRLLSGIEINQNQRPATNTDYVVPSSFGYQTFHLPENFQRAGVDAPDITGVQVCLNVTDINLSVDWTFEYDLNGVWTVIDSGTEVGSHAVGTRIWFDIYLTEDFSVEPEFLERQFRIGIKTTAPWWYSLPNPLPDEDHSLSAGAAMFRVLTASADSGTDFLGNTYRSVVKRNAAENISTVSANVNTHWLSKPNPSKFAVESLYFDLSDDDGHATVVDRILVDPITPNVIFHMYYSSHGDPGFDNESWDDRLWTPVLHTFKAERRQEHALPEPISARYIKIEFSHLQAQSYAAGTFQTPIRYQKHPKWVLDYFLKINNVDVTGDPFIARQVNIGYNALKFAFDYYLDDLRQEPMGPPNPVAVQQFLADRSDLSDQLAFDTSQRISTNLAIFQDRIAAIARIRDSVLATGVTNSTGNHPSEARVPAEADTTQVSTIERGELVQELQFPTMFFYVTARHKYREVEATFQEDRAYFVGIRELAFNRDQYTVASDTPLYIESTGDMTNTWRSDFVSVDGTWRVHDG